MADRRDAGSTGNFRPETPQEAWERRQDERLAEVKLQAQRDQNLKQHDPVEYARQERDKQQRAEREQRDTQVKKAWVSERSGADSTERSDKWKDRLSDKARAEVEILQRKSPHEREHSRDGR